MHAPDATTLTAAVIFTATYFVVAAGRMPGFRIDRTGAAIIGASLMVAGNVLTMEEAWNAIHYDTILLLFGMMIVVANLRLSGFFRLVASMVVERSHSPQALLVAVVVVSGVLSAFFVNDTMCIVLTPMVLEVSIALGRNPVPYLLALAMSSNIGSVATITGNPQNMIIGSLSGISYLRFTAQLAPVALAGMLLTVIWIGWLYRAEFRGHAKVVVPHHGVRVYRPLLWKSGIAAVFMIGGFFAGWPVSKVALTAGAFVLITRRVKPDKVYRELDFSLLVLFAGLFVVVAGMEKTSLAADVLGSGPGLHLSRPAVLAAASAVLSNIVSNVPAVLLFKPFLRHLPDPDQAWLVLAMSSTFAGNFTIVGSVANLIVVQRAKPEVDISFREYFRAGAPLTIATLLLGVAWLSL